MAEKKHQKVLRSLNQQLLVKTDPSNKDAEDSLQGQEGA